MSAQYAPTELTESGGAEYAELTVPGLSHKIQQFTCGKNLTLKPEFEFNQLVNPQVPIAKQRLFVQSLVVPSKKAQNVLTGSPPRVMFLWPNLFAMTCRVLDFEFKHSFFAPTGDDAIFKVTLTLAEARDTRLYMEDVLTQGTMRGA